MSVTEFIEFMSRKNRQNSLTNIIPQTNSSIKNDSRSTSENQYINIVFITEEKLVTSIKRRYESQVIIFKKCNILQNSLFYFISLDFKCYFENTSKIITKSTC